MQKEAVVTICLFTEIRKTMINLSRQMVPQPRFKMRSFPEAEALS